jgi:uncharacterized protein involved in propanediol utilization
LRLTHIVGIKNEDEIPVEDFNRAENPQKVINLIKTLGGIAIIGHPYWSSLTINDLVNITGYAGIEVYNTTCDLSIARGYSNVHWDDLLSIGQKVNALAVNDAHSKTGATLSSDIAKAWIMVRAEQLSA